jgi:hypothetical protein
LKIGTALPQASADVLDGDIDVETQAFFGNRLFGLPMEEIGR